MGGGGGGGIMYVSVPERFFFVKHDVCHEKSFCACIGFNILIIEQNVKSTKQKSEVHPCESLTSRAVKHFDFQNM